MPYPVVLLELPSPELELPPPELDEERPPVVVVSAPDPELLLELVSLDVPLVLVLDEPVVGASEVLVRRCPAQPPGGDLGALDDDGFLRITGRKKELIKTSGGKYVAPAKIEGRLKGHTIVQEAVVVGDRRNYCVCLLSIDPEELSEWASQNDVPADPQDPAVPKVLDAQVAQGE